MGGSVSWESPRNDPDCSTAAGCNCTCCVYRTEVSVNRPGRCVRPEEKSAWGGDDRG